MQESATVEPCRALRSRLAPVVLAAAVFGACAALEARSDGPTFDEPTYVMAASLMGDEVDPGNHEHPPLSKWLFLQGQRLLSSPRPSTGDSVFEWLVGDALIASRAVSVTAGASLCALIAWISLPYGVGASAAAGLSAAVLPSFLAHGHLATVDMLLALFFALACAAADAFAARRTPAACVLVAVAVGAAVSTKWTALLLVPVLPAATFVAARGAVRDRLNRALLILAACCGGLAISAGIYQGTVGFGSLARGIAFQAEHARAGHNVVFLGRARAAGTPAFYFTALGMVTPFALWPLAWLGRRALVRRVCIWGPPLALLVILSFSRVQLGTRYVLPVYVPLLIAAGAGVEMLRAKRRVLVAGGLLVAFAASSLAYSSHLSYRNEARFFSRWRGLEWLPESDGDWGQGAPSLALDVRKLGVEKVCIAWYGAPYWRTHPDLAQRASRPGECTTGAVGAFLLFADDRFERLRSVTPLNSGSTVFLFDLSRDPELAMAWSGGPR